MCYQEEEDKYQNHTVILPDSRELVKMVRPLRRTGAMTKFTVKQTEAIIIKKIEPMVDKVKDSYFMFYKNLEHYPY